MILHLVRVIGIAAGLGTLASLAYYILCLGSAAGFLRARRTVARNRPAGTLPPVSILKPLKGIDPGMYESLRSHCLQEYPQYEIIFGVSDANDPAIEFVERLKAEFPQRSIRLLISPKCLGANTKVSNLAQMLPEARHENLLVNDSDIRVEADYLRRVVAPLTDPKTGMITCLYRGVAGASLGSRLESLSIGTDFCAGVLAARWIEDGIRFGLGSTLAFRRSDLAAIGGFEAVVDYLADDYEIGSRISALGKEVKLSEVVVETFLPSYTLGEFLRHQLRWARTIRHSRPGGYLGMGLTFGLPWALLALACTGGARWAWCLLAVAVALRAAAALVVGKLVLGDQRVAPRLALVPLRDLVALLIWLGGFAGHGITWRGDAFELKNGKLVRSGP